MKLKSAFVSLRMPEQLQMSKKTIGVKGNWNKYSNEEGNYPKCP